MTLGHQALDAANYAQLLLWTYAWWMARRGLCHYRREPVGLIDTIALVALFGYVMGFVFCLWRMATLL